MELAALNERFGAAEAEDVLLWADAAFAPDLSMACSFGGPSGMVLLDMIARLGLGIEVFYLDSDLLFPQAYALRDEIVRRYGITPVAYRSRLSLDEQAQRHGDKLWLSDPDRCCYLRKVEPNARALAGKRAWISGIRRDQASTRADVQTVNWDVTFELIKLAPLAAWSEDKVWAYVRAHNVPYNPLHDEGYPSIGCWPCTRPVRPGDGMRAGRWSGQAKTECGLHLSPIRA